MIEYWKNLDLRDLFYINDNGLVCCEEWRDVVGYEGYYQISDLGRIKTCERYIMRMSRKGIYYPKLSKQRVMKQQKQKGYLRISLTDENKIESRHSVHRLVAIAFILNPENKPQVNHKGEKPNKSDNRVWMIEWNTPKENTNHAIENGLRNPPKHENHPNAKLNWDIVNLIRRYFLIYPSGNIKKICDKFSIKKRTVYSVVYNEIWIDENLQKIKIDTSKKYTLSDEQILEIRKIGYSISSIVLGKKYGVSSSTILAIRNRTGSYKNK